MAIPHVIRGFKGMTEVTGLSRSEIQRQIAAGRLHPPFPATAHGKYKLWLGEWAEQFNSMRIAEAETARRANKRAARKARP
jgi:hypothetical protein